MGATLGPQKLKGCRSILPGAFSCISWHVEVELKTALLRVFTYILCSVPSLALCLAGAQVHCLGQSGLKAVFLCIFLLLLFNGTIFTDIVMMIIL